MKRLNLLSIGIIAATAAAWCGAAHAQVNLLAEDRVIEAGANVFNDNGIDSDVNPIMANDLDPFNETTSASAMFEGGFSMGSATQNSIITPTLFMGSGSLMGDLSGSADVTAQFQGQSTFTVQFTVDQPLTFDFDSSFTTGIDNPGGNIAFVFGQATLAIAGGDILFDEMFGPTMSETTTDFAFDGTLLPGNTYSLLVRVGASFFADAPGNPDGGSYNFTMSIVPAPGAAALLFAPIMFGRRRRY